MPNRQTQRLNRFIDESRYIDVYYSGRLLTDFFVGNIEIAEAYRFRLSDTVALKGLTVLGEDETFRNQTEGLFLPWLRAHNGHICCHIIHSSENGYQFCYASESEALNPTAAIESGLVQANTETADMQRVFGGKQSRGYIVNLGLKDAASYVAFLHTMEGKEFTLGFFSVPIQQESLTNEIANLNVMLLNLRSVVQNQQNYGRDTVYHVTAIIPAVEGACKTLERCIALLSGQPRYLFAYASSPNPETYKDLIHRLAGVSKPSEDNACTPKSLNYGQSDRQDEIVFLPNQSVLEKNYTSIWGNHFATVAAVDVIATWFAPPMSQQKGYSPIKLNQNEPNELPFANYQNPNSAASISLGMLDNGTAIGVPLHSLTKHTLIVGATGYGKTTTAIRLLQEAYRNGVPFVVIEAANKHYWQFVEQAPIRVYSAGADALPLKINPFIPENGTRIATHVQGLVEAFCSTFEQIDPIPQVVSEMVYRCYDKCGILLQEEASVGLNYPTIQDFFGTLQDVLTMYPDAETRNRITGAVNMRLTALRRGMIGTVIKGDENTSISEMYKTSTVIELDDVDGKDKQFIALILALKVNEFLRSQPLNMDKRPLKYLFVMEEAHHILSKPNENGTELHTDVGGHFAQMLAELSALGVGIITVDQRPDMLNRGAIANSAVKIIHRLQDGADVNVIREAMMLDELQTRMISHLREGQAIVSMPTEQGLFQVQIQRVRFANPKEKIWQMFVPYEETQSYDWQAALNQFKAADCSFQGLQQAINHIQLIWKGPMSRSYRMIAANNLCVRAELPVNNIRRLLFRLFQELQRGE